MAGYIEDRWYKKGPADPETGKPTRAPTDRHGKGKRYRVAGVPGVRDRSFTTLITPQGARAWLAKAQHESTKGEFIDPRDGSILLRDYAEVDWWPNKTGDPATLATIRGRVWNHVLPYLGHMSLNAIKTPQLRVWLKEIGPKTGDGTINEAWVYLSAILQAAVEDDRIPKNYCRAQSSVRPPARPQRKARAWAKSIVLQVRTAIPERYQPMVDIGIGAGLRQGEVLGLAVDDIDADTQTIHVRRQVKKIGSKLVFALPKGQKTRSVPVPPHLITVLQAHLLKFPAKKVELPWGDPEEATTEKEARQRAPQTFELLFTAPRGGAIRRNSWDLRVWKPALVAAGLIPEPEIVRTPIKSRPGYFRNEKKYSESRANGFHSLRHTFASVQLDAREPIVAVSNWLGHEDSSITLKIYAHMMPEADGRGRTAMQAWFESES